jgi:2,4-didehydro-3-deoxy-L-rhamnonate hydrolase
MKLRTPPIGAPIPPEPILFNKLANTIVGPNDHVMMPKGSLKLDWEVEIAFVIGSRCRYVEEKDALKHIAGYAVCNDVSERHFQIERGGQWMKGKCFETSGPLGPWLVTTDEIKDVQNLSMFLDVNGKRMQTGNTKTMIFSIAHCLHYISQFMVLEAGDVVTTGTPPGVGLGMKPNVFLKAGDVMKLGIEGLGEQTQTVVPFKM